MTTVCKACGGRTMCKYPSGTFYSRHGIRMSDRSTSWLCRKCWTRVLASMVGVKSSTGLGWDVLGVALRDYLTDPNNYCGTVRINNDIHARSHV